MEFRKHIRDERNKRRQEALTIVKQLDNLEDKRSLEVEEAKERKGWRDIVGGEDLKLQMNWRQQLRQLWLHEGDANTRFFYTSANGRRQQNQIVKVTVGD